MAPLAVRLFGGLEIDVDASSTHALPRQARGMLAYLIANRESHHSRDFLAGLYWADLPSADARKRLTQTLWRIQRSLHDLGLGDALVRDRELVGLRSDLAVEIDVERFDHLIDQARQLDGAAHRRSRLDVLREALGLYRGDFLEGSYDDWLLIERERLRRRRVGALHDVVRLARALDEPELGVHYAHQLTHIEPLDEQGHRALIVLLHALGRNAEAVQQYERCRTILHEELGIAPHPDTVATYEAVVGAATPGRSAPPQRAGAPRFVGRDPERRELLDLVDLLADGKGGVVLLEGDAGIGKTRLLTEIAGDGAWRDLAVVRGAAEQVALPYGAIREILADALTSRSVARIADAVDPTTLAVVARLVPALRDMVPDLVDEVDLDPAHEPNRLREATISILTELARANPLLAIVDDLHLADHETLRTLADLADTDGADELLLIVAYRTDEASTRPEVRELLRKLGRCTGSVRLRLDPLDPGETAALTRASGSDLPAYDVAALHRASGGNPLFILQTLGALADDGAPGELPIAPTVREAIAHRLDRLDPDARLVSAALAAAATPLSVPELAKVTDRPLGRTAEALDDLLRRQLVAEHHDHTFVAPEHIRSVAYDHHPPASRVELHRGLAEVLAERADTHPAVVAHHFTLGERWELAVMYHSAAAEAATSVHAFADAAASYRGALACAAPAGLSDAELFEMLNAHVAVLDLLGERTEQAGIVDRLRRAADDRRRELRAELRAAELFSATDRLDQAERAARAALALASEVDDADLRASAHLALARVLRYHGDPAEALELLHQAVEVATDLAQRARATHELGDLLCDLTRYDEAELVLERALDAYEVVGDLRGRAAAIGHLAIAHVEQGKHQQAAVHYREALELCRRIGFRYGEGLNLMNLANLHYFTEDVGEALRLYDQAIEIDRSIRHRRGEALVLLNASSVRIDVLGDHEGAEAMLHRVLHLVDSIGDLGCAAQCHEMLGLVSAATGRRDAGELFDVALSRAAQTGQRYIEAQVRISAARAAMLKGRPDEGLVHLSHAEQLGQEANLADLLADTLLWKARAHCTLGDVAAARAVLERLRGRRGMAPSFGYLSSWTEAQIVDAEGGDPTELVHQARDRMLAVLQTLDETDRTTSLSRIPEHRAIQAAWDAIQPTSVDVELPALASDTIAVTVTVTVTHPDDTSVEAGATRRRHRMRRLIAEATAQGAVITAQELAEVLDVSPATARRDLARLRAAGVEIPSRRDRSVTAN